MPDEKLAEMPPGMTVVDMTDPAPPAKRDGSVQRATFQQVQALVIQGSGKKAAIAQIAAEQGKTAGAVQGAYYAARSKLLAPPIRPRAKPGPRVGSHRRPSVAPTPSDAPELNALIRRIVGNINDLAALIQAERELNAELRARLDQARDAVG